MEQIIILEIEFQFGDTADVIYPVLLVDNYHMVLIDCGYTGFLPQIETAIEKHGLNPNDLTHVVITHQDHDHMGALYDLKQKYPHIKLAAGEKDVPYIEGKKKFLRLEQAEKMQVHLPEEQKRFGEAFCNVLKSVKPVEVDIILSEGNLLDWCGGCRVLETPGHTPGHISLFLQRENLLIAGDAAVIGEGKPVIANPQFTLNKQLAEESLDRILNYGAHRLVCYHSGIYQVEK